MRRDGAFTVRACATNPNVFRSMSKITQDLGRVTWKPCVTMLISGLYLVTGRELLPEGVTYLANLEESVRDGNVSMVQIR